MAKINYIVSGVNRLIGAGESFPYYYEHFALYCDTTIDLINETLNTEFKTIQEAYEDSTETPEDEIPETFNYKEIPEKYIRSILIYHTAALFLEEEDEFEDQYKVYRDRALSSLAEWRKLEYSDFDITDSTYPYEALKPYQDYLHNVDKFYNHTDQLEKDYEDLIERDKAREDE